MKRYTKEEAISIVVACAEQYQNELEGRNLLSVCTDKHKQVITAEFSFYKSNYMHLTGLKPPKRQADASSELHANDFYQKCLEHKLSSNDFDFAEDGTTHMKLNVLPSIICGNLHASMVGAYNSAMPRLYTEKIVGSVRACMGFTRDRKTLEYVPNTVVQEDARNLIQSNPARVVAVFRKRISEEKYEELTYKAKKVDWPALVFPAGYEYLSEKVQS